MTTSSNEYAKTLIEKIIVDQEDYLRFNKLGNFIYKGRQIREYYGEDKNRKTCREDDFKYYIGTCLPDITDVVDNIEKFPDGMLVSCYKGKYIESVGQVRKMIADKTPIVVDCRLFGAGAEDFKGASVSVLIGKKKKEIVFDENEADGFFKLFRHLKRTSTYTIEELDRELPENYLVLLDLIKPDFGKPKRTFVTNWLLSRKNEILSRSLGLCPYNGKQLREWFGERKSEKDVGEREFFLSIRAYLPKLENIYETIDDYDDDHLIVWRRGIDTAKNIKELMRGKEPVVISCHADQYWYQFNGATAKVLIGKNVCRVCFNEHEKEKFSSFLKKYDSCRCNTVYTIDDLDKFLPLEKTKKLVPELPKRTLGKMRPTFVSDVLRKNAESVLASSLAHCRYNGKQICEWFDIPPAKRDTPEDELFAYIAGFLPRLEDVYPIIEYFHDDELIICRPGYSIDTAGNIKKSMKEKSPVLLEYENDETKIRTKLLTGTEIQTAEFELKEQEHVLKYDRQPLTKYKVRDVDQKL